MRHLINLTLFPLFIISCGNAETLQQTQCRPLDMDKAQLLDLRETKFEISEPAKREQFANELMDCLKNPDPELRDKIGYEGFSVLLRSKALTAETVKTLRARLVEILNNPASNPNGFEQPFAALVLSEVVRVDRITPIFTDEERRETVEAAARYLKNITDYRGFDEAEGWRHGVAHSADVLLQLSLNPEVTPEDLSKMREAIASQIVPKNAHFYRYGEAERLARPILFMARRGVVSAEDWAAWFEQLADPAPLESWNAAYGSQAGLAKLHNTKAFANAVYVQAANSQNPNVQALAEPALAVLKKMP